MANGVVGNPYVGAKVEGVIVKQGKQKKNNSIQIQTK